MVRALSLSAVLVVVIVLAGQAQVAQRPKPAGVYYPRRPAAAAPAQAEEQPGSPDRQPKTEAIPPHAPGLPHDIAPQHAMASVAEGQLKLVRFSFQNQQRNVVAKIEVAGESTAESIVRTVPAGFAHVSWHELNEIRAYADGKELDAAQLADKLAKTTHVLISTKKVDPFYLDVFKDGTIQLILPASLVHENQAAPSGFFPYQAAPVAAPAQ
ncbi:MAG TPA: hypothetical protein VN699_12455 [Pirellulales bacterium]|nr:hypothetical protein [Pirellulales bacterium]